MAFELDPNNYLSHEYNTYLTHLQEMALSKPADYFKLRRQAENKVKTEVSRYLFKTIYYLLSKATVSQLDGREGDFIYDGIAGVDKATFSPKYPAQKINEICLSSVKTIDEILDEIFDILLPPSITQVLGEKLSKQGKATL